ncbi:MAG: small subunit ribosomal protein S8 [Candidatus Berkelbacteria bacterium Licking1014_7]|uniref:Small ribosomal subunit protein uS8 n=1 Tax=Candidatus Berkelbacteria bacterium Licking1014_7 TaxID=2017147 RepID=A0A554LKI5_9BACT|nr:MAG: small subunit ribosomal protein S8 [Candidatus Berkelbacteria bacterium Licking1014_7]
MTQDPISNMLVSIKNGYSQNKANVSTPFSKIKIEILRVLKKTNYIKDFKYNEIKRSIQIDLKYFDDFPAINLIKRISKPSRRAYSQAKNIPRPRLGYGIIVMSTPEGVMTHQTAKKKRLGGEIICEVA